MTQRLHRTFGGVVLAFGFTLLALPAVASPAARTARDHAPRAVSSAPNGGLLHAIWQLVVGDPNGVKPTQGPTVDPNGYSVH
ncbi:MAG TPA: hypothetical protein VFE33_33100 [Thermoanaerobaculia bacterium]|nr:hypothetical protein [Thermoanaerobaculia bacterium]